MLNRNPLLMGSSDVAIPIGVESYQSGIRLQSRMRGMPLKDADNESTRRGTIREPIIKQLLAAELGWEIEDVPTILGTGKLKRFCDSPDGIVLNGPDGKGALEIKDVHSSQAWEWTQGSYPVKHLPQSHSHSFFTRLPVTYLVGFVYGEPLVRIIPRDDEFIANMHESCLEWIAKHVDGDEPLLADSSADWAEYLARKYPRTTKDVVAADSGSLAMMREYRRLAEEIDDLKDKKDYLANAIKARIGSAYKLQGDGYSATWSGSTRQTFQAKAAIDAGDIPRDIVQKYTKTTEVNQLRISEKRK